MTSRSGSTEPIIDSREVQLIPMEVEDYDNGNTRHRGSKVWTTDQVEEMDYDRCEFQLLWLVAGVLRTSTFQSAVFSSFLNSHCDFV